MRMTTLHHGRAWHPLRSVVLVPDSWEPTMWVLETDPSPLGETNKLQRHLSSPTMTAFFKDYVLLGSPLPFISSQPRFAVPGLPSQAPSLFHLPYVLLPVPYPHPPSTPSFITCFIFF